MPRQEINLGAAANDKTGDKLRVGGIKINENFIELYNLYAELLALIGGGATGTLTTVAAATTSPTNTSPIPVTITFDQSVIGFTIGDITVTNGTASNFTALSGAEYTVDITPTAQGAVTVTIPADVAGGAGGPNLVSNVLNVVYDSAAPTVDSFDILTPGSGTTTFQLIFNEGVTGVDIGDFIVVSSGITGSINNVVPVSPTTYNVITVHSGSGTIRVSLTDSGHGIADLSGNAFAPSGPTLSEERTIAAPTTNNERYWGHSTANSITTSNGIKALALTGNGAGYDAPIPNGSATDNDKTFIITARATESFAYYAFPARFGAAPNMVFNSFPANSDWVEQAQVLVTPDGGVEESYRVYRTLNKFDSEANIQIS